MRDHFFTALFFMVKWWRVQSGTAVPTTPLRVRRGRTPGGPQTAQNFAPSAVGAAPREAATPDGARLSRLWKSWQKVGKTGMKKGTV